MARDAQTVSPQAQQRSLIDHFGAPAHVDIFDQAIAHRRAVEDRLGRLPDLDVLERAVRSAILDGMSSDGAASALEPALVRTDDGAELAVWSMGPTDADTVMLVHGFSLDHTTWHAVAKRLVASGYRVVLPDLRGHGRSTLGSHSPTSDRLVGDVNSIIVELQLPTLHLVGHSLGAVIALSARTDYELASKIESVTSVAGTERSIHNPVMRLGARLFSSTLGIAMLKRQTPGRVMISAWFGKKPNTEQLDWIRTLSADCSPETRRAITGATGRLDLRPSFATTGPSTLVMVGDSDRATPVKFSKHIAEAIPDAELAVIEDSGHMVIIEQPDAVSDRLVSWFTSRH